MILRPLFEKLFKFREQAAQSPRMRPGADEGFDPHEKPFLDHLEDLRKTLMKVIIALLITTILGFAFHKQIFHFVLKPLEIASFVNPATGEPDGSLAERISFMVLSPPEILMLSIKVSFFAGLIGAFPLLVFFIGEFVLPGLRQQEKKLIIPGIGVGFFLFITGAAFAFFLATPIALKFFYEFQIDRVGLVNPELTEQRQFVPISIDNDDGSVKAADLLEDGVEGLGSESRRPGADENGAGADGDSATDPEADDNADGEGDGATSLADGAAAPPSTSSLSESERDAIRAYLMELIVVEQGAGVQVYFHKPSGKLVVSTGDRQKIQYRIGEYISFVTRLVLVFGLSFQLPVVVTILVKLQLLTARVMRATRAFAWVIMLVLAAIFTPPDVFTLALLAGPLILLYEICIWIAWGMESKREKARLLEEQSERERLAALYSKPADDLSEEEKHELHRREIEQYEREHADMGYDHDDPHHGDFEHDPHALGYDPHHDESWDDPHHDAEAHEPIQDWPDRDFDHDHDQKDGDQSNDASPKPEPGSGVFDANADVESSADHGHGDEISGETSLESDHAEPTADETASENGGDDNHEPCQPAGSIINPNVASLEELTTLPGVDDELADHIILYRPFDNFDELLEVPGMDDDILNAIIDRLELE